VCQKAHFGKVASEIIKPIVTNMAIINKLDNIVNAILAG